MAYLLFFFAKGGCCTIQVGTLTYICLKASSRLFKIFGGLLSILLEF